MLVISLLQVLSGLFLLAISPAFGSEGGAPCFDFSQKVTEPLRLAPDWKSPDKVDVSARAKVRGGEKNKPKSGYVWGQARGLIKKPIGRLVDLMLDHNTTKSAKIRETKLMKSSDSNYFSRHLVTFEVTSMFTFSWSEEWAYALARGTVEKPERVVISYQKTEGTSHIKHLCGNIVLEKVGASLTDVYAYEEVYATLRTDEDTESGLIGTLMTLRK